MFAAGGVSVAAAAAAAASAAVCDAVSAYKTACRFGRKESSTNIYYKMVVRDQNLDFNTVVLDINLRPEKKYGVSIRIVPGSVDTDDITDDLPCIWKSEMLLYESLEKSNEINKHVATSEDPCTPNLKRINGIYIPEIGSTLVLDRCGGISCMGLFPYDKTGCLSVEHIGQTRHARGKGIRVWRLHEIWWELDVLSSRKSGGSRPDVVRIEPASATQKKSGASRKSGV
jgi:hypothetical protein